MSRTRGWVPISRETDPTRQAERMRTVTRRLREHRVTRAGADPCPVCAGGPADTPTLDAGDACRCTPEQRQDWQGQISAMHRRVTDTWTPPAFVRGPHAPRHEPAEEAS